MNLLDLYEKQNMEEIFQYIIVPEFINNVKAYLEQKEANICARVFISHYLLWKFPEFHSILPDSPLWKLCDNIIQCVKNNSPFGNSIELYQRAFNHWKRRNSNDMIEDFQVTVNQLNHSIVNETDTDQQEGYDMLKTSLKCSIDMLKRNQS